MKYASGLSYKVLKAVADRGAVGSLTRGYAREVGGHWQFVLNYTVPDPSTNRGTRQHRITKNFPELASCGRRARAKDGVERKELPVWREQVIADVKSIAIAAFG